LYGYCQGKIIGYYGRAFKPEKQVNHKIQQDKKSSGHNNHRGNLRIPRQDLRQMLLDKLAPGTVHWNHKCENVEEIQDQDCVNVYFDNGNHVQADLVVGADGLRSRVRRLRDQSVDVRGVIPRLERGIQYIGVSVILGISSFKHPLLHQQGYYVLDGTHRLFTMPFREDKDGNTILTMWQLSFSGLSEGTYSHIT
jgi:salicylate hydroxylase